MKQKRCIALGALLLACSLVFSGCTFTAFGYEIGYEGGFVFAPAEAPEPPVLEKVPGAPAGNPYGLSLDWEVTEENILKFAAAVDPDAWQVLYAADRAGADLTSYYTDGNILSAFETTVHEMNHQESADKSFHLEGMNAIYTGSGTWTRIRLNTFGMVKSDRIAELVPEELRSFRYDTYVLGTDSSNMGSVMYGCYGLLDEFAAYYWGNHAIFSAYDFLCTQEPTLDTWRPFLSAGMNLESCGEFRYFILTYLMYLRDNEPGKYEKILKNEAFCSAYRTIQKAFTALERDFWEKILELPNRFPQITLTDGHLVFTEGDRRLGMPISDEDDRAFARALLAPEYAELERLLLEE